ncbi:uncharacterized protein LOC127721925 isoform X2 [Mytilus californianus]|uniref:uncharacterized protein LOC127721925 isoform X2 n=1 Tax=Mytilus californianus TaxID=6549 RepID=UPI0022485F38|nr:uncharacterized protein LOC127721925 isoform X2 [Mytilus californianus]
MTYVLLFINAIVVALMAKYVYDNERRFGEISAKLDRTEAQMALDISKNEKRLEEFLNELKYDRTVVAQMVQDISNNVKRIGEISAEQKKDQSVVAQMALIISKNEKRIGEISAEQKKDQSVVAQMVLDISKNEKRIGEISAEQKKDQSVVAQMTLAISKIEKRTEEISAKLKNDQSEIRPAFTAYFKNGGYMNLGHQKLIFDSVQLNVGGGYNPGTGYFTVPRAGLYLVSCKVRSNHRTHLHVYLMKNDKRVVLGYGENYNEGSFSIPVQVAKGDRLVIHHGTTGESVEGGLSSFFSAVFISD